MSIKSRLFIASTSISIVSFLLLLLLFLLPPAFGYGSLGPIAAAFGDGGMFCAIDASGKQEVVCWDKQNKTITSSTSSVTSSSATRFIASLPPMASLSGGEGFMCGITSDSSKPHCWDLADSGKYLVPEPHRRVSYSLIAPGKDHVCAVRGEYFSDPDSFGVVDCWGFVNGSSNVDFNAVGGLRSLVSGEGFSCGAVKDRTAVLCWGPKSTGLGLTTIPGDFEGLVSSRRSVCGIASATREVKCWGDAAEFGSPEEETGFVTLSAGAGYYCGVREDDHRVQCWGGTGPWPAAPRGPGFAAIASSDSVTCGVREVGLVLDCWGLAGVSAPDYSPPLELVSPGTCSPAAGPCGPEKFAFNATSLEEADLTSLCLRKELKICLPCGTSCSNGYFPWRPCDGASDRVCAACSLCQNSSCRDTCKISTPMMSSSPSDSDRQEIVKKLVLVTSSLLSGSLLALISWFLLARVIRGGRRKRVVVEEGPEINGPIATTSSLIGTAQAFRLSELKDATNGFKEYNELGRGSFGFVYRAVLADGSQLAVKRANAATIIRTKLKDFEAEVEILSSLRHANIVNVLGHCAEMGERLMVYEYMPHGTVHDCLHGDLPPLDWPARVKISLQVARGLEYLHTQVNPPMAHRGVKTSNIFLDSERVARLSEFGGFDGDTRSDVYDFGVVLVEILSGRKPFDLDRNPRGIVDWALPIIRSGKSAAVIDSSLDLPRNVEPLLRLADIAELALNENPAERPSISEIVCLLEQAIKNGTII